MSERCVQLEEIFPVMAEVLARGGTVCFEPKGVSMLPMLRQGVDSVTLSALPDRRLKKYDLPLYRRASGQFVLHRIVKAGETYTCIGDNQFEFETGLKQEQMLALVTAFKRGERTYSVTHPGYRLYCRLWHWSRPVRRFLRRVKATVRRRLRER